MNDIRKFLSGDINVVDLGDGVILSKETTKSSELWHISIDGEDKKSFWVSKKNTSAKKGDYTGGKQPYLMTMVNNIKDIRKAAIGNLQEQLGFIVLIGEYIEWQTGRLYDKNKKQQLRYNELLKLSNMSNKKFNSMLKDMKSNNLLEHNSDGYFISRKFIKKGGKEWKQI